MLQVWVSGGVPSFAGQAGLWFLFSEKVTFASSELVYMRGATGPLLKPSWGSASTNFYCSVYLFLLPRSDLVLSNVGVCVPLTSVSMRGWLLSTVQGRGDLNGKEMWEGVESKGEAGTDFFPSDFVMLVPQNQGSGSLFHYQLDLSLDFPRCKLLTSLSFLWPSTTSLFEFDAKLCNTVKYWEI